MGLFYAEIGRMQSVVDRLAKHVEKKLAEARPAHEKDADAKTQAQNSAIALITPLVRRMLLTNLKASGIGKASGALERAVSQASVWYSKRRNAIMIGFAPGIATKSTGLSKKGKRKRGKGTAVYVYGSALNFGAVRSSSRSTQGVKLGGKAKRTLKGIALGTKTPTLRQLKWLQKSGVNAFAAHSGKSVGAGGFTFIKPRHFFQLSSAQSKYIAGLFAKLMAKQASGTTAKAA